LENVNVFIYYRLTKIYNAPGTCFSIFIVNK